MSAPCPKCRPLWVFRDEADRAAVETLFVPVCEAKHALERAIEARAWPALSLARRVVEACVDEFVTDRFRRADAAVVAAEAALEAAYGPITAELACRRSAA